MKLTMNFDMMVNTNCSFFNGRIRNCSLFNGCLGSRSERERENCNVSFCSCMEEKSWTSMRFCGNWRPWQLSKLLLVYILIYAHVGLLHVVGTWGTHRGDEPEGKDDRVARGSVVASGPWLAAALIFSRMACEVGTRVPMAASCAALRLMVMAKRVNVVATLSCSPGPACLSHGPFSCGPWHIRRLSLGICSSCGIFNLHAWTHVILGFYYRSLFAC